MISVEKKISALVENQFPEFYKDEGVMFIAFMKAYYEWLESSEQTLYHARRLAEYRDVDDTIDDFVVHFKEKYLRNIQFQTESNKKLFVKHALDFYRSKGTERSTDLFFKLIYGIPASVYYPGDDLFKLSAGDWNAPAYIEVSPSSRNQDFIGKQITGLSSGATAFVDDYVVRRAKSNYIHVFFISEIVGNFTTGELVAYDSDYDNLPIMTGSLTSATVTDGGAGFSLGETVNFVSDFGSYGKARVSEVQDIAGTVSITLADGGFGYSSNSQVLVSNNVLVVAGISNLSFSTFETITQDLVRITYVSSNGTFVEGTTVNKHYANNNVAGSGKIVSTNSTALIVSTATGNLQLGTAYVYTSGNTIRANATAYAVLTATANVIAQGSNVIITANSYTGTFTPGELITQSNSTGFQVANAVVKTVTASGANIVVATTQANGIFKTGLTITGVTSGKTANVVSYANKIGVKSVSNTFYANGYLTSGTSGTNGTVQSISSGSGATFTLGANSTFVYSETSNTNTDKVSFIAALSLNAVAFGFPKTPTANISSPIIDWLTFQDLFYGSISNSSITLINPGVNYTDAPFISVYDPSSYAFGARDYIIQISSASGSFSTGEQVKQCNSSGGIYTNAAVGLINSGNSSLLYVKRLKLGNSFSASVAAQSYIIGLSSNVLAQITSVSANTNSLLSGLNAVISTEAAVSNGSVVSMNIINSGFGYSDEESVLFYRSSNSSIAGEATLYLQNQGVGLGYYREDGGFLSDTKKLHDGEYYQEYSYDIQTELPLNRYAEMFKKVAHVAGTKLFGSYVQEAHVSIGSGTASANITLA